MIYTSYFAKLKELEKMVLYQFQSVPKLLIGIKDYSIRNWLRNTGSLWSGRKPMTMNII